MGHQARRASMPKEMCAESAHTDERRMEMCAESAHTNERRYQRGGGSKVSETYEATSGGAAASRAPATDASATALAAIAASASGGATSVIDDYLHIIKQQLEEIASASRDKIGEAAQLVADAVANDGIVYTFGTGHSHCAAEEVVYRAGGLAPVDAILEPSLTGTTDVVKSEQMERLEGIGEVILNHRRLTDNDVLIIVSNSGRNAAPIDMAIGAKARGVPTIAITSMQYSSQVTARHSSGKHLYEVADVVIDNAAVFGDAALHLEGLAPPVGPTSNMMALFILHTITAEAAQRLLARGMTPPVFWSGNLDGAEDRNRALLDKYWNRIRVW